MGRSEEEFFNSRYSKIQKMIDIYTDEKQMEAAEINRQSYCSKYFAPPVETVSSMKDIEGFV